MKFFAAATLFFGLASAIPTQLVARDCSAEVAAFNLARREKRGLALGKRTIYQGLQNTTCVLAPEVAKVNYVANAPVRTDIREGQAGLALTMDIGVMDITTCKPMANTMVELWGPNAVGNYGTTFLRGSQPTTSTGIAEFQTVFPGFSDGANHLNVAVHSGSSLSTSTVHSGQVFFTDRWTDLISTTAAYQGNTHSRVMNAQDSKFASANARGYSAIVDIESIHDDWPEGVVGYITVGVNPKA
ncbi:hypothetical protein PQX77_019588 [Marasmius sp. AFHP31]|nr:hypothetical protein PQX77_019588 [Marasmius sp. AFHP31]